MQLRIAVGQISCESNHFVWRTSEAAHFRNTGYAYEGGELFRLRKRDTEVSGALSVLEKDGSVEIVPLLAARANSTGPLSASCYAWLKDGLLGRLRQAGRVDAVFLSHHGSMAAENEDDPEGDIAREARKIVGPSVPIVMTLDLHGNVTRKMVQAATAIVGYNHYPHDDVFTTGVRAAGLLLRAVRGEAKPVMALAKLPMLLTAFHATTTGEGPFARLMNTAKELEMRGGILSASLFFVGSYIDTPEIGCGALVVADGNAGTAVAAAERLGEQFWARRADFTVATVSTAEAVRLGREIEGGPVLLLDSADTTGGGAAGDGIGLVRELLACGVTEPCMAMVVDAAAASRCVEAGIGKELTLPVGHANDPAWGKLLMMTGRVINTCDGFFTYNGGILGGSRVTMGPSAVLESGPVKLLIMSHPTYDWADEQYRAAGLTPERAKFVGVKNMMNFRMGYRDMMKGYFVLQIPGPTPADMRSLPFRRIRRPIFPFDDFETTPDFAVARSRPPRQPG